MPTNHGYRERIPSNLYDAFRPRDLRDTNNLLFGNRNIGNSFFTNMQVPFGNLSDQTMIVLNWYARTNLTIRPEFQAAWDAWAHATTATLVLGNMPVHSLPLSDLLQRKEGQGRIDGTDNESAVEALAKHLFCTFYDGKPESSEGQWQWDMPDCELSIPSLARARWLMVASEAMRTLQAPLIAIVPVRQSFKVMLNTNSRALGAMREVMPTNVAPEALVWVHLEGQLSRSF